MSEMPEDVSDFTEKMLDECDIGWRGQYIDPDLAAKMINDFILAERSACAKIAEEWAEGERKDEFDNGIWTAACGIARQIRRR